MTSSATWVIGEDYVLNLTEKNELVKRYPDERIHDAILEETGAMLVVTNKRVIRVSCDGSDMQEVSVFSLTEFKVAGTLIGECRGIWLAGTGETIHHIREDGTIESCGFPDYKGSQGGGFLQSPRVLFTERLGNTLYMALRYPGKGCVYAILNERTEEWEIAPYYSKVVPPLLACWNQQVIKLDSSFEKLPLPVDICIGKADNVSQRNLYFQVSPDQFIAQEAIAESWGSRQKLVYLNLRERRVLSELQTRAMAVLGLFPRGMTVEYWGLGLLHRSPLKKGKLDQGYYWNIDRK